jgi:hypothetical protein
MIRWAPALLAVLLTLAAGCGPTVTVKHEVDAHVTLDVNLRVDRQLDDFFSDVEKELGESPDADQAAATKTPEKKKAK